MPAISRFFGSVIAMYFDDHGPPHFQARHAEGTAKVRIDTLEVIESSLERRQLRFVLAWAELLALTFADGLQGEVVVLDRMRGPVFDQARTADFAKVRVDGETGTVVWPGGADLAPDTLYEPHPNRRLARPTRRRLTAARHPKRSGPPESSPSAGSDRELGVGKAR